MVCRREGHCFLHIFCNDYSMQHVSKIGVQAAHSFGFVSFIHDRTLVEQHDSEMLWQRPMDTIFLLA